MKLDATYFGNSAAISFENNQLATDEHSTILAFKNLVTMPTIIFKENIIIKIIKLLTLISKSFNIFLINIRENLNSV